MNVAPEVPHWNGQPDPIVRLPPGTCRLPLPQGFLCPRHLVSGACEVLAGEYEPGLPAGMLEADWRPHVLDVGANVGAFATWALHRWPGCIVHSYEPNPRAFEVLERNAVIGGFTVEWSRHAAAIVGELVGPATAILHEGGLNLGEASLHVDVGAKADEGIPVSVVDAAELAAAQVVKVDTEGCELEILDRYLATHATPAIVMFEFHRAIDRLVLEELLSWYGLALWRGHVRSPCRGTLVFARLQQETIARTPGDVERARAAAERVAGLYAPPRPRVERVP
jgi:FkbM family methyltransferase